MLLLTRNDPKKHPMLKKLISSQGLDITSEIKNHRWFKIFHLTKLQGPSGLLITDDPIAYLFGRIFLRQGISHRKIWALEIYEEQISATNIKTYIRKIIFFLSSYLTFIDADSIIFPSNLRKEYTNKKYPFAKVTYKSDIVLNIPEMPKPADELPENIENEIVYLRKKFRVIAIYSGSLQGGRGLSKLVNEIENQSDIALILCGSNKGTDLLKNSREWKSTKYLGNFESNIVAAIYRRCDVGILSYENKPDNTRLCAPVKIWEYLDSNLKIVGNKNEALMNEWSHYIDDYFDIEKGDTTQSIMNAFKKQKYKGKIPNFEIEKITKFS